MEEKGQEGEAKSDCPILTKDSTALITMLIMGSIQLLISLFYAYIVCSLIRHVVQLSGVVHQQLI